MLPRKISRKATGADAVFVYSFRMVGASVLVITGGVGLFLAWQAFPTLRHYGWSFLTTQQWSPESDVVGIAAVLVGTIEVACVAMFFAFPLALVTALFITEYSPLRARPFLVSMVDLMAAVPSIIWGLWGFFLVMPHAAALAHWLQQALRLAPVLRRRRGRERPRLGRVPLRGERLLRRHRSGGDGAPDGVCGDAPGLLPGPTGGA